MNSFYTFFGSSFDGILVSGYRNGKKFNEKVAYSPFLFVQGNGEYKTYDGKSLEKLDFESIREARDFLKRYADVSNFSVFGFTNFPYVYAYENFKEQTPDLSLIRIGNFDIETDSENGFGDVQKADREIITLSFKVFNEKIFYVFGMKEYETKEPELLKLIEQGYQIKYVKCVNEKQLLTRFIRFWNDQQIDMICGWNIEMFDIPYLIKRINIVLSELDARSLSPFKQLNHKTIEVYGKINDLYEIVGIPVIDSMQAYKKFSFVNSESYSLNYISGKILNATKLDYSEYRTLARLYKENFNKFVDYNIIDVWRVEQIDQYLGYMNLMFTIAYHALVNYIDTFTTVRIWDVMIHNYLMDQKIAVKGGATETKQAQIAGGYVKEPQVGKHSAVMSFDFTSLYPHLTMLCNISPDTLLGAFDPIKVTDMSVAEGQIPPSVEKIMRGSLDEYREDMIKENMTVSGRGNVFTRNKTGFIPQLMKDLFAQRKVFTKLEEENEALLAKIDHEIHLRGLKND